MSETIFFISFIILIAFLLALDLGVLHKKDKEVTFKESAIQTGIWVTLAIAFFFFIRFGGHLIHNVHDNDKIVELHQKYHDDLNIDPSAPFEENLKLYNKNLSLEYITGYAMEETLSIDNIFVMIMILMSFGVEKKYYHRVLFYGILGAIVLRFIFIFAAAALIQKFRWVLFIFGGVLIYSGVKMFLERNKDEHIDVEHHPVVKFFTKRHWSTPNFDGHNFFSKVDGKWLCTPLFIVLLIIEFSDIIFAFDSVPAVFSVTNDPYIVFFSNIFAIMGLRSLFFMLESVLDRFWFLKIGLSALLTFIGVKMLLPLVHLHIGTMASLFVIIGILTLSIIVSIVFPKRRTGTI
ncbi:MAG: TerC/Alx family metal homeostasis membrane protein [Bacteroidales bacterium]|nr:TerC/Alx family metal homeostasis membrane protein [Bacteroidales bacterium]